MSTNTPPTIDRAELLVLGSPPPALAPARPRSPAYANAPTLEMARHDPEAMTAEYGPHWSPLRIAADYLAAQCAHADVQAEAARVGVLPADIVAHRYAADHVERALRKRMGEMLGVARKGTYTLVEALADRIIDLKAQKREPFTPAQIAELKALRARLWGEALGGSPPARVGLAVRIAHADRAALGVAAPPLPAPKPLSQVFGIGAPRALAEALSAPRSPSVSEVAASPKAFVDASARPSATPPAPASQSTLPHGLSARELRMCAEMGIDPAVYAADKAAAPRTAPVAAPVVDPSAPLTAREWRTIDDTGCPAAAYLDERARGCAIALPAGVSVVPADREDAIKLGVSPEAAALARHCAAERRSVALASMSTREQRVAEEAGVTPEDYVAERFAFHGR